jgi:uncharacterized membrane-anchored protein YitT (DUF2179 family)
MVALVSGSMLIAVGIDFFLVPIHVLDGGFIGLALIANYLAGVKVGLALFLFSIPVFAYAWSADRTMMFQSVYGMLFSTYFIDMLEPLSFDFRHGFILNPFASSVLGGLCIGVGLGLLLRYGASTGGMDLLARLLTRRYRINIGILILMMDAVVVSLGGLLFSSDTFYLSVAAICVGDLATGLLMMRDHDNNDRNHNHNDYRYIGRL